MGSYLCPEVQLADRWPSCYSPSSSPCFLLPTALCQALSQLRTLHLLFWPGTLSQPPVADFSSFPCWLSGHSFPKAIPGPPLEETTRLSLLCIFFILSITVCITSFIYLFICLLSVFPRGGYELLGCFSLCSNQNSTWHGQGTQSIFF